MHITEKYLMARAFKAHKKCDRDHSRILYKKEHKKIKFMTKVLVSSAVKLP